jgi:transcriptional regulator with XRE-family HTH domain
MNSSKVTVEDNKRIYSNLKRVRNKELGISLHELRISKGISLAALAKASGYTASHLCGAENGDHCSAFAMQAMFDAIEIADKYPKARIEVAIRNLPEGEFTTKQLAERLSFPTTRIVADLLERGLIKRINRVRYRRIDD